MAEVGIVRVRMLPPALDELRDFFETLRPKTAICWDLDSTLRSSLQRHHLSPVHTQAEHSSGTLAQSDWLEYNKAGQHDAPQLGPIAMMRVAHEAGYQNHVVSGSSELARAESESWLNEHAPLYHALRLRQENELGDSGELKAQYVLGLKAQGIEVLAFWEDWVPAAKTITERTGVPCVVVNPVYPGMCTCGYVQQEVDLGGTGSAK